MDYPVAISILAAVVVLTWLVRLALRRRRPRRVRERDVDLQIQQFSGKRDDRR